MCNTYAQTAQMYTNYNQNLTINKDGNNFMYMPNYAFTPYQMQQMNAGNDDFGKAYKKWYKDPKQGDDNQDEEEDEGSDSSKSKSDDDSDKKRKRKEKKAKKKDKKKKASKKAAKKTENSWRLTVHGLINLS